jgi:integrase
VWRGNSTLTGQRPALALREKVEGREPWQDDPEVCELVRYHDYAGKLVTAQTEIQSRGALTLDLLKLVISEAAEIAAALAVQYFACLRIGELFCLTVDCLSADGVLHIRTNKRLKAAATKERAEQKKPMDEDAIAIIKHAQRIAEEAGRPSTARLFSFSVAEYRKKFKAAVQKADIALEDLVFVPHSIRHGRVTDMKAASPTGELSEEQLKLAGMSSGTSMRYGRSNQERIDRKRAKVPEEDFSSSDEE